MKPEKHRKELLWFQQAWDSATTASERADWRGDVEHGQHCRELARGYRAKANRHRKILCGLAGLPHDPEHFMRPGP
jgi:hypothetical protein